MRLSRPPAAARSRGGELERQLVSQLAQLRRPRVALGDRQLARRQRPLDRHVGIVPGDAALELRVVVGRLLVDHVGDVAEHAEAVREAGRHEQLAHADVVQLEAVPAPVRRRAAAQVDRDVENPPARAAHELRQALADLEVHAAQDAACRARVVVLHEAHVLGDPQLGVPLAAVGLTEEPALVAKGDRLDRDEARQLCLNDPHSRKRVSASRRTPIFGGA
jgi:hypothetical protein